MRFTGLFYDYIGWRGLLMIGIAPALLIIYIRLFVKEPEVWVENQRQQKLQGREVRAPLFSIFKPEMLGNTLTTCLMMASAFVIYYANYALFATHLQLDLHLSPALVALPIALANTCFFLSSLFWGWLAERIGRRWAIIIPAALGVPTAFLYLLTQDYTLIVIGFALQGMFACGGMHVQYPAYLSERFPTEVRATAVAFCFHQGAIWGGLISPLLILYATTHQYRPFRSDSRHHGGGLGHLPCRGAVEPGDERQGTCRRPDRRLKLPFKARRGRRCDCVCHEAAALRAPPG